MIKVNISFSILANVLRLSLGLATFSLLSKIITLYEFGVYTYLTVITGYLSTFVDFGFNLSTLKEIPQKKQMLKNIFYETIFSKLILICIATPVLVSYLLFFEEVIDPILLVVFSIIAILQSTSIYVCHIFKSFNRFDVDLYYSAINNSLPLIIILSINRNMDIFMIAKVFLFSRLISALLIFIYFFYYFLDYKIKVSLKLNNKRIRKNIKFAIHMIFAGLLLSIDVPIMKYTLGIESVAIYTAGMKLFVALVLFGDVVNTSFFPNMSSCYISNRREFNNNAIKLTTSIFLAGAIIALCVYFFGSFFINIIYSSKFIQLEEFLPIFSVALFIRFISLPYGNLLTIGGMQKIRANIIICIFVFHVTSNVVFQNILGIKGAILSTCLSFTILTITYLYYTHKHYGNYFFPQLGVLRTTINNFLNRGQPP